MNNISGAKNTNNAKSTAKGAEVTLKDNGKESIVKCYAKVNLGLDVIGEREDGYHDVELIFDSINLYDILNIRLVKSGITLFCNDKSLPTDENNIAYLSARRMLEKVDNKVGVEIELDKKIPHGAGLAGGSADAAGVLLGLNQMLFKQGYLPNMLSDKELAEIGVTIGADVPFCIMGGTAFAEGVGEILTPIKKADFYYVVVKPQCSVSTAYVYNNLDLTKRPENLSVTKAAEGIKNNDIDMFIKHTGNIMESVTASKFPIIYDIKKELSNNGALLSMMSGSGTAVFGAFKDLNLATAASEKLSHFGKVYVC